MLWALPSRGRPRSLQRFLEAYGDTGATASVFLRLDGDDEALSAYQALRLPGTWTVSVGTRTKAAGTMAEAFAAHPEHDSYGFVGDDGIPLTKEWDWRLAEVAGPTGIAYPDDLLCGARHASHPVVGGELLRAIGWWALPGLTHLYTDTVFDWLGRQLGCLRYCPEVVIEHRHFSTGKSPMDATYSRVLNGEDYATKDRECFERWISSGAAQALTERLRPIAR